VIRLFVAIVPPRDMRARLSSLCGGVPGARWVEPDNLHLTLRFIGEIEEPLIEDIVFALRAIRMEAFPLTLSSVGHFERRGRVRQIWAGIMPSPQLMDLQRRVESAILRAGIRSESRRFTPHVTLARLKDVKIEAVGAWLQANGPFRGFPITVAGFTLFASYLGGGGPVYQPIEDFALADPV
jgi:RNA 2',3'-cyclic 3'-phosphodiesterase